MRAALLLLLVPALAHADVPKGSVKGTVTYEGEAPEAPVPDRKSDPYCNKTKLPSDELIVTHGKVKDAIVRVLNMPKTAPPAEPLTLDQKQCTYSPHVSGIVAGQKIRVRNSDGTFHNVRGTIDGKALWNKPHAQGAPDLDLAPDTKAGDIVEVQCDVHPWMHAYIAVQDSASFVVTKEDGQFEITGLPMGTYTIESWHPKLGKKTMKIEIGRGARANVNARLSYKP